jgi:hypothetical protein
MQLQQQFDALGDTTPAVVVFEKNRDSLEGCRPVYSIACCDEAAVERTRWGGTGGECISDGFGSETHLEVLILPTDQADGG